MSNFLKLPMCVADKLCQIDIGNAELRVFMAICRKTYGWHKDSDRISYGQLEKITGLKRRCLIYAAQNLSAMNMIAKADNVLGNDYMVNERVDEWVVHNCALPTARKRQKNKERIKKIRSERSPTSNPTDSSSAQLCTSGGAQHIKTPSAQLCTHNRYESTKETIKDTSSPLESDILNKKSAEYKAKYNVEKTPARLLVEWTRKIKEGVPIKV